MKPDTNAPRAIQSPAPSRPKQASAAEALFGAPIGRYTRAQAIADGVLVDLSALAREAGLRWPCAVTAAAWALIETIPATHAWQDVTGRAWDVLMVARFACSIALAGENEVHFRVNLAHAGGALAEFKLTLGPGDDAAPVLTLLLVHED
jgi:hypothetical protein